MKYPKPVMNQTGLVKMGISKAFLAKAYAEKSQTFAWKANPEKENSPILYDTEGLEKYRLKQIENEKKARRCREVV